MRLKLYLIWLCLAPIPLLANVDVDSLITLYNQNNHPQRSAIAQQLIDYFLQEDFYDYPITPKFLRNKELSHMLVYLGTANYYYFENRFSAARQYAEKALPTIPKDSLRWIAHCYQLLDVIAQRQGNFNSALDYAQKRLAIAEKLRNNTLKSSALNSMATINLSTEHYDEALRYIDEAIQIERSMPQDTRNLCVRLGIKCEILMCMHRPDEALVYIDEALKLDEAAGRIDKQGIRLSQKADILLDQKKWTECRQICLQAMKIFQDNKQIVDRIIVLKQLGMCEMGDNHYAKAESYLLEGEQLCREIGLNPLLWRIQNQLYQLYKKTNQLEKAVQYLEKSTSIKDSLNNERYQQLISEYQVAYETHEKEKQLEDQDKLLKNRLRLLILTLSLLALLASLTVVSLSLARVRKKNNERLSLLNKTRNQIFSVVSHDLKNPVQAQKQVLHYICDHYDQISDTDKKRQIAELKKSNDSLSDLLFNLLDWASLETGRLNYKPIRADLSTLTKDVVRKIQPFAAMKNVNLSIMIPANTFVLADMRYFESILYNLLHNAIKFSFENGNVEIESEEADHHIFLKVTDHGVGIPPEEQERIFKQEMVSTAGTSGESGTGIGLMICKELLERSNSQRNLTSIPGQYTTFSFTLPKAE
ncbi:MAG: tetratricopeptide repeat protein [Bacteroidales bacterium]|nr:tetratricopeptide repeat protein [Bacteroidales bacterium]